MFVRAGRRHIVNWNWIDKVDLAVTGGLIVTLRGSRTVEMARRQSGRLPRNRTRPLVEPGST